MPSGDTRQEHLRDIIHLPEFHKLEIQHFFEVYKQLEPGKAVLGDVSWSGRREAEAEVTKGHRAATARPAPIGKQRGEERSSSPAGE